MDKNNFKLTSFTILNLTNNIVTNLTIKCIDGQFEVNSDVWSNICPVFATMITTEMKEKKTLTINFPTFTIDCIKQFYYASYTNSDLSINLLEEFVYLAHQYQLTNLLNGCINIILTLIPYQKFFDYDNKFNLNIYNKLINNFFTLTSKDDIPIYNDIKIYLSLWQQLKDKFYPIDITNIIIKSYLASNLVCNDIPIKNENKNSLITSLDSTVVDNNVNIDIIINLKLQQLKNLLTNCDLLANSDYNDIVDYLVYNKNKNNINMVKIYALKEVGYYQKQLKINYRTGEWSIVNQDLVKICNIQQVGCDQKQSKIECSIVNKK